MVLQLVKQARELVDAADNILMMQLTESGELPGTLDEIKEKVAQSFEAIPSVLRQLNAATGGQDLSDSDDASQALTSLQTAQDKLCAWVAKTLHTKFEETIRAIEEHVSEEFKAKNAGLQAAAEMYTGNGPTVPSAVDQQFLLRCHLAVI